MELNPIQNEIQKALVALGQHARFSEAILAKKIRENAKIEGKKKAGIALADLEKALDYLSENNLGNYSLMLNSANDLLLEKTEISRPLEKEVHQRRLKSERSMSLLTNGDLRSKKTSKPKTLNKTERKHININSNFEEEE